MGEGIEESRDGRRRKRKKERRKKDWSGNWWRSVMRERKL